MMSGQDFWTNCQRVWIPKRRSKTQNLPQFERAALRRTEQSRREGRRKRKEVGRREEVESCERGGRKGE